jgi:hypothetical protein
VNPEAVAGLEIGYVRDGKGLPGTLDADLDLGTDEIKSGVVGAGCTSEEQQRNGDSEMTKKVNNNPVEAHYSPLPDSLTDR